MWGAQQRLAFDKRPGLSNHDYRSKTHTWECAFFFQMHQQLRANKDEGAGSKMRDARVVHGVVLKREWCKDNLKQARRSYERNHELGLKSKRKTDIAENGL